MSSTNRGTVSAEQDLWLIGPGGMTVPLTANLHYSCRDPYAVMMSLDAGRDEPIEWALSRELLTAALHTRQGIGDVRAWPSPAPAACAGKAAGEKILNIELGPPGGYARFTAGAAGIEAFLALTYELAPIGKEPDFLDLDAELTELLRRAC
jgi:hypothetical protein